MGLEGDLIGGGEDLLGQSAVPPPPGEPGCVRVQPRSQGDGAQGCSPAKEARGAQGRPGGGGRGRRKTKGCEALNSKRCF